MANVLVKQRRQARRPRRSPNRKVGCRVWYCISPRCAPGAVYLPLNTAYTLNELEYFITDAEAVAGGVRSVEGRKQ